MKYEFKKIVPTDLNKNPMNGAKEFYKVIAEIIFANCHNNLDLVEIARKINLGEIVEVEKAEINEIKNIINGPKGITHAGIKKQTLDYIDSIKK